MVSVWFDPSARRASDLGAVLEFGGEGRRGPAMEAAVDTIGRRGVVLETPSGLAVAHSRRFAWLNLTLPGGERIRPLVEIGEVNGGRTPVRFKHLMPNHQHALDAFHQGRATPAGY